ncbi:MAG: hypothetical protein CM1200mP18_00820 [Gammaproteobacteria bacterium]|nr:MAG: hypothetical protein CM1200mP18_00820 [Gammaproteobacteria bacterium]
MASQLGFKDNMRLADGHDQWFGYPTNFNADADIVINLRAGRVMLGSANMDEGALGAEGFKFPHHGPL